MSRHGLAPEEKKLVSSTTSSTKTNPDPFKPKLLTASAPGGSNKANPVTPTKMAREDRKGDPTASSPGHSSDSGRSARFSDVALHSDSDDGSLEVIHHTDAPHSAYNSHADHVRKYDEMDKADSVETKTRPSFDSFEKVERDSGGTSSRNGAADRPEKYK